jgi:cation transporter-like permease
MLSSTITGAIISSFESRLTVFPALIAFIPMLMGTAGNSGSQSSVTVIRGISLGEIEFRDLLKVLWKELRVGIISSIALAVVNFGKMWLVDYWLLGAFDSGKQLVEITVVCITLLFTVIMAKVIGCIMPMLAKQFGFDPDDIPGSGAAGGLGTALMVFLKGEMRSGIETVLDLIKFDERLEGVDLCVTGEGRTDWQSCFGKVMQGVGMHAKAKGVPVLGLSGGLGKDAMNICDYGVNSLMTTVNSPMDITEAIDRAEELYYEGAVRMFRFVKTGMDMR